MIAVFLLDFGGPETLDDVRPFLKNLFSDRAIMPLPAQEIMAHFIAKFRAPKVIKYYEAIGGGSPLPKQSRDIAAQLERAFQKANLEIRVFTGFRYTPPFIGDLLLQIADLNPKGIILLPMFPHYSTATTLSVLTAFQEAYDKQKLNIPFQIIEWWFDEPQYIAGWCYSISRAMEKFDPKIRPQVPILFTAHSLPVSFVTERNDPYPKQIRECCEKIVTYFGGNHPAYIAYQSKIGRQEWLSPSTIDFVKELGAKGCKNLVIVPISFITDHVETLYEIDQLIIPKAKAAGIEKAVRCEALYYGPHLKKALEELVLKKMAFLLKE